MISLYISSSFVRFQVGGESLEVSCAWGNGLYYFKCGRTHEHLAHVGPALILAMRLRGKRVCCSRLYNAYCPECIPESKGRRCDCGAVWICEACLVEYSVDPGPRYPKLISCPRCGTDYCMEGCRYCHFCSVCKRTSICVGCQTSEGDVGGEDMSGKILQPPSTIEKCLQCRVYICNE